MPTNSPFIFVDKVPENTDAFTGTVRHGITESAVLLEEIESVLHFPAYFGCNWNALSDCLRDFSWVSEKSVRLVHSDVPRLPPTDLKIYIAVLSDAVQDWSQDESHVLTVIFPQANEAQVNALLQS